MLSPLVVESSGRGGTTLTMALLASSSQVAMDRQHPFEHFYFAWMVEWAALVDRTDWDAERWNTQAFVATHPYGPSDGLLGPPPWRPRQLWEAEEPGDELGPRLLLAAWREFSAQAIARTRRDLGEPRADVRYHAEKALSVARLRAISPFPVRALMLHRDPRDVWLSILAFERARGFAGFGYRPDESEQQRLERFLAEQAQRLRLMLAQREDPESLLVSYEQLVGDPEATTAKLAGWLEIELDPAAPARNLERNRGHSTSASPEASVARWRRELAPRDRERFAAAMGAELRELGYGE